MKHIFHQVNTRVRQYWWILLIFEFCMFFSYCLFIQTWRLRSFDFTVYMFEEPVSLLSFSILVFMLVFFSYSMHRVYRFGRNRWKLLNKNYSYLVIGDIIFLFCVIMGTLLVYYLCIKYGYHDKITHLKTIKAMPTSVPTFADTLYRNINFSILYPTSIINRIYNIVGISTIASVFTYAIHMNVNQKDSKKTFLFMFLIIILVFISINLNIHLGALLNLIIIILCIYLSVQTWSEKSTGGTHVKN